MNIGYDKPLYIQPFDHRGSFQTKMFGWKGTLSAEQTAEIAAEHLKIKCREDKLLAPGFARPELERVLKKYPEESLMVVGHEPDFSDTIGQLTGASLKLSKAGVALVELDRSWRNGRLLWLFPPKIAKK